MNSDTLVVTSYLLSQASGGVVQPPEGDVIFNDDAARGETFSLKMDSGKSNQYMRTYMEVSTDSPEQYWRFEAIPTSKQ